MCQSSIILTAPTSTPRASLAALGLQLQQLDLFGPIREQVHIPQKTVRYTPSEKLYDAFIALLAGAQGLVEINTRLRSDPALQRAFGRAACAEQSVVQATLDACDATTVAQMEAAIDAIYRQHGQGYRHPFAEAWQLLDADMTGLPCGPKAALATPGYFARQRNRRGRQLGRVLATIYHEVVVDRLFDGTTQLRRALVPLIEAAERTLELDEARRTRTIIRVDAGGGTLEDVNWLLSRGYRILLKEYSGHRARNLAASVTTWVDDPLFPGRQLGWVTAVASDYVRPVQRIAVRCRKRNGQWGIAVLITNVPGTALGALLGQGLPDSTDPTAVLLATVYAYDRRGGGVETAIKEDKQGLGLGRRNKKRFEAQQMVSYLGALAHNVLVWARTWLARTVAQLAQFGIKRLVRDVLQINGTIEWDCAGHISRVVLNQAHCLARRVAMALQALIPSQHVVITWGET